MPMYCFDHIWSLNRQFDLIRSTDRQVAQPPLRTQFQSLTGQALPGARRTGHRLLLPHSRSTKVPLLNIVVLLIVVGVGLYLINRYIPMASSIKSILNVVVVVVVCVWLLQVVGLWGDVTSFRLHR
jgi:hypothetical protein